MGTYNSYIEGLRGKGIEGDFDKLKAGIEARVGRERVRGRLALAGTLTICFVGLMLYLSPYFFGSPVTLTDYIFESNDLNGNQALNYVFAD